MELAAAYEKVGDVLGNPSNPNLGRTNDALKSYEKSLQLRLAASGRAVDTADEADVHAKTGFDLAQQYGALADRRLAFMRQAELALRRGDLPHAETAYREAMTLARTEAQQKPGLESTATIATAASRLGYVYKMEDRQKECLDTLAIALDALQRLSAAEPAKTSHVRQMVRIHNDRGDTLRNPFVAEGS